MPPSFYEFTDMQILYGNPRQADIRNPLDENRYKYILSNTVLTYQKFFSTHLHNTLQ